MRRALTLGAVRYRTTKPGTWRKRRRDAVPTYVKGRRIALIPKPRHRVRPGRAVASPPPISSVQLRTLSRQQRRARRRAGLESARQQRKLMHR